jgi:hypothetical protein
MTYRLTLTVPSRHELPDDLYRGDTDYHEGWTFATHDEAETFGRNAVAGHPGVVVGYEIRETAVNITVETVMAGNDSTAVCGDDFYLYAVVDWDVDPDEGYHVLFVSLDEAECSEFAEAQRGLAR